MEEFLKSLTRTLVSLIILLGLLFASVPTPAQAQVIPPGTQPIPTTDPLEKMTSPAPQGLKSAGWSWYDGLIQRSTIINCVSIIYPPWIYEYGGSAYVGYYANPGAGHPIPNSVYYVHVVLYGLGNACSGIYAYVDIGLPPNTALAISATNPVYCFADGVSIHRMSTNFTGRLLITMVFLKFPLQQPIIHGHYPRDITGNSKFPFIQPQR